MLIVNQLILKLQWKNSIIYFTIITSLLIHLNTFGQDTNSKTTRIEEIKKWYAEVGKLNSKNCQTKTFVKYDSFSSESEKLPFDQKIIICQPSNTYQTITAELSGYEWGAKTHIYKKNEKIFFVFIEGSSEGFSYEKRFYCDKDEIIILQLEKEAEGGADFSAPNKEIKLTSDNLSIKEALSEDFSQINKMLSEGK